MLKKIVNASWDKMAPFWPLQNLIAVNPLNGFENLPIEEALKKARVTFEQESWPAEIDEINRATIKWCQTYFDIDQATLKLPGRQDGFYSSLRALLPHDQLIHQGQKACQEWLKNLPEAPFETIKVCLQKLKIAEKDQETFLFLLLVTLPGWAAHVKYLSDWAPNAKEDLKIDYLALRLVLAVCLWPKAKDLLLFYHEKLQKSEDHDPRLKLAAEHEQEFRKTVQGQLGEQAKNINEDHSKRDAQLVFCIDVRSEPMRRMIEKQGNYQTIGFAGFFGLPIAIRDTLTKVEHATCPVLLKPASTIEKNPFHIKTARQFYRTLHAVKRLYQALKYSFLTPLALVEATGSLFGAWGIMRSLFPRFASNSKKKISTELGEISATNFDLSAIPAEAQIALASGALKMMGMIENFSDTVVFCGHGSTTRNNAFASSLDCGACGGHEGLDNARILALILNQQSVRKALVQYGITIPESTTFYGARHDTTTDGIAIIAPGDDNNLVDLRKSLSKAQTENNLNRLHHIPLVKPSKAMAQVLSSDWAQVRPEWGLARNACLIVGPRVWTKHINLEGRSFLHEYAWQADKDAAILTTIMTAPMVVAHWINMQYFFSTLNPIAYGAGSKVTQNITGKKGVMQGNASDLMHGLALQSVYKDDVTPYHQPLRLQVFIYGPKKRIESIIAAQPKIAELINNQWIFVHGYDPEAKQWHGY
jgi:hypothetical protein